MNVENIRKVIDAIKAEEIAKFDMGHWRIETHSCGTVACIAGFAASLNPDYEYDEEKEFFRIVKTGRFHGAAVAGQYFLDIENTEADELFTPDFITDYSAVTAEHAIAVLEHLIKFGVVDWSVAGITEVE